MLGDIHIAEPGAHHRLRRRARHRRARSARQLPEGFQRSEYLLEHGMVDIVVQRQELRETLVAVIVAPAAIPRPAPVRRAETTRPSPSPPDLPGPERGWRGDRHPRPGCRRSHPQAHRSEPRPGVPRLLGTRSRPSPRSAPAAGHPCRRHQRQGLDLSPSCAPCREAAGRRVHVYHLAPPVSISRERIRLAGAA